MLVNCQQKENSRKTLSDWPSSSLCSSQCGWPQLELVENIVVKVDSTNQLNSSSSSGKLWWPARLWQRADPHLLGLCLLSDGDHVHRRVRRHLLHDHPWSRIPGKRKAWWIELRQLSLSRCFSSPLVSPSLPLPSPRSSSCLDSAANMVEPSRMKGGETIVETSHDNRFHQASHSGVWAHHLWVGHLLPQGLSSSWPRKGAEEYHP